MEKAKRKFRLKKQAPNRSLWGDGLMLLVLILCGTFMVLPLIYAICNAIKPLEELFLFPPRFFVRNPTLNNFHDIFVLMSQSWVPFTRYVFNTVFITLTGTVGHLLVASLCAFALAKHRFPGRNLIFGVIVTALMFSNQVTAIPNYLIMSKLNWLDTYFSLIIPAIAAPLGLFLMKQFMEQIPDTLLEAARIDGAGEFITFLKIGMPMVKPAWLTLIIFSFQDLWNMQGANYIYSEELKTLPYALSQISAGGIARAGAASAVVVIMMSVPIIVFIISQSSIIETMASSGIKE